MLRDKIATVSNILKDLNSDQHQAVTTTQGPLLIIAGAGTGKTAVIVRRIAYIIEKKLAKPSQILALTFTDKAAAEMEERVDILVPYGFIDTWISTFHAFGDRILRDNALEIGLSPDFKVFSRPQQILFFQQNLFRLELNYFRPLSNPTKFISAILAFFSRLKDENVSPDEFLQFATSEKRQAQSEGEKIEAKKNQELANCYESYEKFKDEAGFLDFGDQVVKTIELFTKRPKILQRYQTQFKYILVDEYQDTNYAQNELVKKLASDHRNICVVGDDDQCLPTGTLINTPTSLVSIEELKVDDQVLTAVGKGHLGISKITKIFKNKKPARLLKITTKSGRRLTLTDNHKVFCYVPSRSPKGQYHYVYLMYRQNLGWRIGVTNDLATRLRLERSADKIIGLRSFKTDTEARYHEMLWVIKYGIPPTVFQERSNAITSDLLLKLYKNIDSQRGSERLADDLHIDLNSPHFTFDAVTRGQSRRIKVNLQICARNYSPKTNGVLKNPLISHEINLQTSNGPIIDLLKKSGFKLTKAKKGFRLRIQSSDLLSLGKLAEKLTQITGGFLEPKSSLGFASIQSKPALVMPAANLVLGHYLPMVKGNRIYYDEIVDIKEEKKTLTVYDLEIEKTHNFVANGIVVHNSIYKFRGAAISNILEFKKTYKNAKVVVLTQNYRSTQAILDSAYRLIRHNDPDRLEVQNNIVKKLKSTDGQGLHPQEIFADTISEEADLVAFEIEKLMMKKRSTRNYSSSEASQPAGEVEKFSTSSNNKYSYRDFAILVRANSQADHFLRALNMKGIPHKFIGSSGLYRQEEVSLLISFLNAISNFEDSLNLYNLMTSDVYQLPPNDAIRLTSWAKRKNRSLYYVLKNLDMLNDGGLEFSSEAKAIIDKLMVDLEEVLGLSRRESVGKVTYDFLKRTGYLKRLERENSVEAQVKIQNIAKFFDKIKEFSDVAKVETVSQFVDYLEAIRGAGDDPATVEFDPELDAVNVMTVHGAKGLEFPVVFLVNLVADRFPLRARSDPIEVPETLIRETLPSGDWHQEEERRLFYVGMTRARDLLYFSWSRDIGGARVKKISPFVLEAQDKPPVKSITRLSPLEKIEKFAPMPAKTSQTLLFDVDVLKLTQGSIDDYLTCAYKYRYIHILRIPILRHHAVVYGAALHAAVAAYLRSKKNGNLLTLPQVLEVFENAWDSEGFLTIEHEERRKAQGKLALENFWKRESKSADVPSLVEASFKFALAGVTVMGRYDRVDVKPGSKVTIVDYKSSENIDTDRAQIQAKESIQLAVYALSYFKNYKIIPERVGLHFLETGIEGFYSPVEKDLEKTEELILETADNIRRDMKNNSFVANPKYFGREPACVYCAYNSICPFSLVKVQ